MNILAMIKDKWELNSEGLDTKDIDKLFEIIGQQQEEIENLQASCRLKQRHIDHIPKIREEYETKLKQANTRIQFLEGLRSAKA